SRITKWCPRRLYSFLPGHILRSSARSTLTPKRYWPTPSSETSSQRRATRPKALRLSSWERCSRRKSPSGAHSPNQWALRSIDQFQRINESFLLRARQGHRMTLFAASAHGSFWHERDVPTRSDNVGSLG